MGRKKIQISRIMDERNRQVNCIFIGLSQFYGQEIFLGVLHFGQLGNNKLRLRLRNENLA